MSSLCFRNQLASGKPLLMGILNATPDSFSDGGRFDTSEAAQAHARKMIEEGADIIDIGGESTRPGHIPVSAEDEQRRVLPIIAAVAPLAREQNVSVSIDTYKSETARAALACGASIVNDIWGLQYDPNMASVAASFNVPVIVMHNRAEIDASLDPIEELRRFFERSIAIARRAGIPDKDIILDPGIGFGKTAEQSIEVLSRLDEICAMGYAVLVGASRKSFIGNIIQRPPAERLYGTLAAHLKALERGATIFRVHDVGPHVEAMSIWQAVAKKK